MTLSFSCGTIFSVALHVIKFNPIFLLFAIANSKIELVTAQKRRDPSPLRFCV